MPRAGSRTAYNGRGHYRWEKQALAKTLVVYYSRTGNTKKIAEEVAAALQADVEELKDGKSRRGPIGFIMAGREAVRKVPANLKALQHDPAAYDLVVVGTPVWANTVCSPVRTFLERNRAGFKSVAWFCTAGAEDPTGAEKAFAAMTEASGLAPAATLGFGQAGIKTDHSQQLSAFVASLSTHR
jgi:flavodoxin